MSLSRTNLVFLGVSSAVSDNREACLSQSEQKPIPQREVKFQEISKPHLNLSSQPSYLNLTREGFFVDKAVFASIDSPRNRPEVTRAARPAMVLQSLCRSSSSRMSDRDPLVAVVIPVVVEQESTKVSTRSISRTHVFRQLRLETDDLAGWPQIQHRLASILNSLVRFCCSQDDKPLSNNDNILDSQFIALQAATNDTDNVSEHERVPSILPKTTNAL
jgi:hypothetical protein